MRQEGWPAIDRQQGTPAGPPPTTTTPPPHPSLPRLPRPPQSGNYHLNFLVWHQRLLYETEEERIAAEQAKNSLFGRAKRFLTSAKH